MGKPQIQNCPTCHKQSMMLTEDGTHYECQNPKCADYKLLVLYLKYHKKHPQLPIDQIFQQQQDKIEAEKKALDESTAKARLWNGNQYWDGKKKKWRDGDQPIRIHRIPAWVVIIGVCIVISIVITLILNYLHPGTSSSFFIL